MVSGKDWALVAHRSHGHLCLSYGAPGVAGASCRLVLPRALSVLEIVPDGHGHARLIGLVAPGVARIDATSPGQEPVRARIYRFPSFFASPLRVFVIELPDGIVRPIPLGRHRHAMPTLTAYARDGSVLRTIHM